MPSQLLWECVNGTYIRDYNVFAFSRNDCSVLQKQIAISRSMPSSHLARYTNSSKLIRRKFSLQKMAAAFLGMQSDFFDSQRDMTSALIGSVLCMALSAIWRRHDNGAARHLMSRPTYARESQALQPVVRSCREADR